MIKKYFFRILFILVTCCYNINVYPAEINNIIKGTIKDSKTGEPLPGASVIVKGSKTGTITDLEGKFIIDKIKSKEITLTFSFISYETKEIECDFSKDNVLELNISLIPSTTQLDQVVVEGQSQGQVKALIEQKLAVNIKNIVSAEQIQQFPDMNAAEVVQRIPGITLQRDQGEGRYIQLRGTPPELTNFNINGEQISSPEGDVRYVGLDVISADQIELIEVTKVLTPDMDADGISGNVNIITKSAQSETPEISASIARGYNNLLGTPNSQLQFSFGQRHNRFGFQMSASYYENNQGSHNMEYDYTRGPTLEQALSGDSAIGAENFHILYEDIEFRHYEITRKRIGLSGNLDYKLNENNIFYLRGMFNNFSDNEVRRRMRHSMSDANTPVYYRSTGIGRDVRERKKTQNISTVNLGAEHKILNDLKIAYEGSISYASDEVPNYLSAEVDQGLIGIWIDKSDPIWPQVRYIDEQDSLNAFNFNSYEFDGMSIRSIKVDDINYSTKLNIEIPYHINGSQHGYVKFGGKIRLKEKQRDVYAMELSEFDQKVDIYSQTAPNFSISALEQEGFYEENFLNHGYVIEKMIDPDKVRQFYEEHPQSFRIDERDYWEETHNEDYIANENIYAGYFMIRHDIRNLMLLAGARYELTKIDYTTYLAWLDFDSQSPTYGTLVKKENKDNRDISFLLPQFQLKYALNERTNLRAALTYSYSRPNFDDILPYRIESPDGDIEKGNPNLNYPESLNADLLAEIYLRESGIISGGIYYKRINNFVFKYVRRAHEGDNFNRFGLTEITMPVNGIEAFVYGAEIQTQFKFKTLPGFLKDFGIYATYTFTESDAYITKRFPQNEKNIIYLFDDFNSDFFLSSDSTEIIPLPGQAKHTSNLALFYDGEKFYAKLSSNYHTEFLDELGNDSGLDVYYDKSFHLDFTANYQFTEYLNCFIDIINLTNAPLRYYMGSTDYFKQQEYYSWWGRVGLKLNFK